jgi:hypothetical protein
MIGHGSIGVFLQHYLPRRVSIDTAAIVRGIDPQTSIMRSACTMSRWIDPNRPWSLTAEQAQSVNNDPLIQSLIKRQDKLKQSYRNKTTKLQIYINLGKRIRSKKQQLRDKLLAEI